MRRLASKLPFLLAAPALTAMLASAQQPERPAARRLQAGNDPHKTYFLIGPRGDRVPDAGYRLLLVLPGGDGGAGFLPFVERIAHRATGEDYLVAEIVAPKWDARQARSLVWPTAKKRWKGMKFSTEELVAAVIRDVASRKKIDPRFIFTLSWSSAGPAAYAVSLQAKTRVTGSLVAMSVFYPGMLPPLRRAKGQAYYLLHSPEDRVCRYALAEHARKRLARSGARVELVDYAGGHGWHGDVYGSIRKGLAWLEKNHARPRIAKGKSKALPVKKKSM